ncbi:MAG: site-2 protease family protein, partial [Candidatus Komeilibacteria bacterium]|nr:site-2 protease family protein [Candidatus Komeilibacteria bacterium]
NLWQGIGVGDNLGGPVAIAVTTNDMVSLGWQYTLLFMAILSFNLAIINILPFPALDGGRIVFFIIEKIRGKPSRQEVEGWFHRIGFALLMLLAIFITYRDIMRFGGRIWGAIIG